MASCFVNIKKFREIFFPRYSFPALFAALPAPANPTKSKVAIWYSVAGAMSDALNMFQPFKNI